MADTQTPSDSIPLTTRVGTQIFELRPSCDAFTEEFIDQSPLGHVLFDASAGSLCVNDQQISEVFWNDVGNSVGWVSSTAHLCEGHLSLSEDCRELIGTVTRRNGDRVVVTGSAKLPPSLKADEGAGAPPAYSSAFLGATGIPMMSTISASPFMFLAAGTPTSSLRLGRTSSEKEISADLTMMEYKTERRKQGSDDDDDWTPWYSLEWSVEESDAAPVICYVNDVDITSGTTLERGDNIVLIKTEGDPSDKKLDYTFRITMISAVEDKDRTFSGLWEQNGKKYEWRGQFKTMRTRNRTVIGGPERAPDGNSLPNLLAITSLSSQSIEVEGKTVRKDLAQTEGDRIFARIILHSAPDDVKQMLYPDLQQLDAAEKKIKDSAQDFFERAGIVNIMTHLQASKDVPQKQRDRINKAKCDAYIPACAAFTIPKEGETDYVKAWGWDREKDKGTVTKFQSQYRSAAQACYRLGYVRAINSFQPFLDNAKEWYGRLANYLVSQSHVMELRQRVKSTDTKITQDIFDWQNKLQILQEEAGDIGDALSVDRIITDLHGVVTFALLDGVMWNDEHANNIKEFFAQLDDYDKDPMKKKSEEYAKLQDLLQDREFSTWSEFGKVLVAGIDDHAKLLNRTPSLAELTTVISRQEAKGFWPKMWQKGKTALRAAVRPAVVMIGAGFLSKTLLEGQGKLSVAEQLSMYTSLVDAMVQTRTSIFKGLKFVAWISTWLAKGLGWGLRKLLPSRALSWISAAKAFGEKAVNAVTGFAERLWARIGKGVAMAFGFIVSVITLYASVEEFKKTMKTGRTVDKWFAGAQLAIAALTTIAFSIQLVASFIGAAVKVAALAGTIGMYLAGIGIVIAIVALIVTLALREDPVEKIIDKYGPQYGLLK